jgi:hypothetical protein
LGRGGNRPLHGNCRKDADKVAGVFHKMSNDPGLSIFITQSQTQGAVGVGSSASLCENSISDHPIRLGTSSKCVISQIGAKFFMLRQFSHSLARC